MKTDYTRACIYPKDIQLIMGKAYKPARLYLKKIKQHLNKGPNQVVSIREFCDFAGLQFEEIRSQIK